jgi:hypothetical protein
MSRYEKLIAQPVDIIDKIQLSWELIHEDMNLRLIDIVSGDDYQLFQQYNIADFWHNNMSSTIDENDLESRYPFATLLSLYDQDKNIDINWILHGFVHDFRVYIMWVINPNRHCFKCSSDSTYNSWFDQCGYGEKEEFARQFQTKFVCLYNWSSDLINVTKVAPGIITECMQGISFLNEIIMQYLTLPEFKVDKLPSSNVYELITWKLNQLVYSDSLKTYKAIPPLYDAPSYEKIRQREYSLARDLELEEKNNLNNLDWSTIPILQDEEYNEEKNTTYNQKFRSRKRFKGKIISSNASKRNLRFL